MYNGYRIDINGELHSFRYRDFQSLSIFVEFIGGGRFKLLEDFKVNEKEYLVYGYDRGTNFNQFDLFHKTARGDIIIIANQCNAIKQEILDYYNDYEDLDNTIIADELNLSVGSYDWEDSFIEDDRDEDTDDVENDYLDFIDYQ